MIINKITYPNIAFSQSQETLRNHQPDKKRVNVAASAFIGAVSPVIAINMLKKGNVSEIINSFKKHKPATDKFKSIWKLLEIENFGQIFATTTGGIVGGLLAGLKNSNTKQEKEAQVLTIKNFRLW